MVGFVTSNANYAHAGAKLYIFEDNEAVIEMIMKGRSPNLRQVFRTHRVALDWLFDRISLDPKIRFRYVDSKNQLADILTNGHFTRINSFFDVGVTTPPVRVRRARLTRVETSFG